MSMLRGLYPIVDLTMLEGRGISPVRFAEALLPSKPALLQLRAKDASEDELRRVARELARLCEGTTTAFVLNDRPDVASELGIEWAHVGQTDFPGAGPAAGFPASWSGLRIGVSTHSPEQLALALTAHPAYVAFGPVFDTTTKENPDETVGLAGLEAAAMLARAKEVPLVAIGGIREERLRDVCTSADLVAVISALVPSGDAGLSSSSFFAEVSRRAETFQRAIRNAAPSRGTS